MRRTSSPHESLAAVLITGGDERLLLDPATGLNRYECSPCPRAAAVEFGSCTGSSPSPLAFEAAGRTLAHLARADAKGMLSGAADDACEANRVELLEALGVADIPGVSAAFTPSGTDAELVPLALALGRTARRVCNIVVGPSEAGSGTAQVASGYHPNDLTPLGARGNHAPLAGGVSSRVVVRTVALRDDDGNLRSPDALDRDVEALTEDAIAAGDTVIVHRMSHSKTGVFAPSLACIEHLQAVCGSRMTVVVDAAQGRIGPSAIRRHLLTGHLVLFTGSKFYGGPPFSGAVLVPASASPANDVDMPVGMNDYLSASDLPLGWRGLRAACSKRHNVGLLLRWRAALEEIRAYRAIPASLRRQIVAAFGQSIESRFSQSDAIVLHAAPRIETGASADDAEPETALPTVYSFSVRSREHGGGHDLGARELRRLAHQLGVDAYSTKEGQGTRDAVLSPRFHLGQPVGIGHPGADAPAVLRVALGAPLVRTIASSPDCGLSFSTRLQWLDGQVAALLVKLDALLEDERLWAEDRAS